MIIPDLSTAEAGSPPSEAELTALKWCADLNPRCVGFMGPSVCRLVPFPEYERLVATGLLRLIAPPTYRRAAEAYGYYITDDGLRALQAAVEAK